MGWPSAIAPPLTLTLRPVEAQLAAVGQDLRRERLVDLDQVERVDGHLDACASSFWTPLTGARKSHLGATSAWA